MSDYLRKTLCILLAVVLTAGLVPVTAQDAELALPPSEIGAYEDFYELPDFDEISPMALEFLLYDEPIEPFSASVANVCAFCVVENMGPGWNLGNTFDATHIGHGAHCTNCIHVSSYNGFAVRSAMGGTGSAGTGIWNCGLSNTTTGGGRRYADDTVAQLETRWLGGSANATTQALIRNVSNAGFETIRIPVTWYKATGGPPEWNINAAWMTRVRRAVQWAYDEGMTVILNTHHEELIFHNWLGNDRRTQSQNFVTRIWTQIATEFGGFGERLVFEGLNEPRVRGHAQEWQGGSAEHRDNVNLLNQAFVNAVRATGSAHPNNRYRILMVPTYAASADARAFGTAGQPGHFTIPNDPTPGPQRIAMSIHAYIPNSFAGVGSGPVTHDFGTVERGQVTTMMDRVINEANARNVPVVFGEWGSVSRSSATNEATRANYSRVYALEAAQRRAAHVWWDNGATNPANHNIVEGNFGLFNRRNQWSGVSHMGLVFPDITAAIVQGHGQGVGRRTGTSRCECIAVTSVPFLNVQQGVGGDMTLTASRPGSTWSLHSGPPTGVTVNATTGVLTVGTNTPAGTHNFVVRATAGPLIANQNFTLRVLGENEAPPGRNYRNLNMTPGADETVMRFTWHSGSPTSSIRIWQQGSPGNARTIASTQTDDFIVNRPGGEGGIAHYYVHQATVSNLSRNSVYQYTVTWLGGESTPKAFRTGGASSFQFIVAGDPQIGTGGIEFDRADWTNTLMNASRAFPQSQFIFSMGDQVATAFPQDNDTAPMGNPQSPTPLQLRGSQRRHDGLFYPRQIHSLPFAPVVGNHDSDSGGGNNVNPWLWRRHYNVPNRQQLNSTLPTNFDYYFRYGDVLFINLNSNDGMRTMGTSRLNWFNGVISRNQDAIWRVVTFHHSPYSVYRASTYTPKTQIINNWIQPFEAANIDIVLAGHDHVYSRTHHMRRGSGSSPTRRLEQRWVNSAGVVRHGEFGTDYHAVLNPLGITYITFGSPTRSNARPAVMSPSRPYILRHHTVYQANQSSGEGLSGYERAVARYGLNRRHISTVTVTPTTFSVATYELDNAASGAANRFRMRDLYTIVRSPNNQVPAGTYIPVMDDVWRTVPDPYIDIPFNWEINATPADINVSGEVADHVRVLRGLEITPCIIASDDDILIRVQYRAGESAGSTRRILAWTDLTGPGNIATLTAANMGGRVAISHPRLDVADTSTEFAVPRGILASGANTATRLYIAITVDAGIGGRDDDGYTRPADHRGGGGSAQREFTRIESVQLIARAEQGIGNPIACIGCGNLPCRCIETRSVQFQIGDGTHTGGGELTQNVPLGAGAQPPVISRPGFIHTWDAPFHSVTSNIVVNAVWTPIGTPFDILYDMNTTDRVGAGFATFSGSGGAGEAIRTAFAPLSRTGNGDNHANGPTVATAMEPSRTITVTNRGGVSQSLFISLGGPGGLGGTGANAIPVVATNMYRIEYTAYFPNGGTPRIRFEGAAGNIMPVDQIPGGVQDGNHVRIDAPVVAAGEVFTHSATLSGAQIAAIIAAVGARSVSLSAVSNATDIHFINIRIVEHSADAPPPMHTITFNANGGTGTMPAQQVLQGSNFPIPVNVFSRIDHTFAGWNTAANGSGTAFDDGATITAVAEDVTLYAQWMQDTVNRPLNLNLHGGTIDPGFPDEIPQTDWTIPVTPVPTLDNHTFGGWALTEGGPAVTEVTDGTIAVTLYALWTRTAWPLASLTPPSAHTMTAAIANAQDVIAALPTTVAIATNPERDTAADIAWTPPGGFNPADGAENNFTWTATLPNGVVNPAGSGIYLTGSIVVTNYTLGIVNRTVTFVPNGGTGDMPPQSVANGSTFALNPNTFALEHHTFAGWATAAGGAVVHADGATITDIQADMTLYAQWTRAEWPLTTLTPPAERALTAEAANYAAAISQLQLAVPTVAITTTPARDTAADIAWTFSGTFDEAAGATNNFTWTATLPAGVVNATPPIQLYGTTAITNFSAENRTVTFVSNGGTGNMPPRNAYGGTFTVPASQFTRENHAFVGWRRTPAGGRIYQPGDDIPNVTADFTLYAQWQEVTGSGHYNMVIGINVVNVIEPGTLRFEGTQVTVTVTGAPPNSTHRVETSIVFYFRVNPLRPLEVPVVVDVNVGADGNGVGHFFKSLDEWNALAYEEGLIASDEEIEYVEDESAAINDIVLTVSEHLPTISISREYASVGEEVTVTFSMLNNPGFTTMSLHVEIPSGLRLVDYESHPDLYDDRQFLGPFSSEFNHACLVTSQGHAIFAWLADEEQDLIPAPPNFEDDGPFLTLTFEVEFAAPEPDGEWEITASFATGRWDTCPGGAYCMVPCYPACDPACALPSCETRCVARDNYGRCLKITRDRILSESPSPDYPYGYELPDFIIVPGAVVVMTGSYILGDVNGDGSVTTADATVLARWLVARAAGQGFDGRFDPRAAKIYANGNGPPNNNDLVTLARWLVGHHVQVGRNNNSGP